MKQATVSASVRSVLAWGVLSLAAAGCATTQQAKITDQNYCPFLGAALCAKLTPTETPGRFSGASVAGSGEAVAHLRYLDPSARWTQYHKVLIAPVTFWAGEASKVSPADQQMLTNYFHAALEEQLSKKLEVAQQAGPGVLTLEVALVDVETATPVLRTISMIVPQARGLNTLKYLATGTYGFIGGAEAEAKIVDSVSGQVLAAAVDRRVGGGALSTAMQWQWGDAENAIQAWSAQTADRLAAWTSGTPPPS